MIGAFGDSLVLLDAGCGAGNLTFFFLGQKYPLSLYIGIDFAHGALLRARGIARAMEQRRENEKSTHGQASIFLQGNLDSPLPLQPSTVDRIVCNLVLSYVNDPLGTLREFARVLKPGGRIVVSTLKSNADCSQIYRNFSAHARTEGDVQKARKLLANAGQIATKEAAGLYMFYSENELADLLDAAGLVPLSSRMSLGNQAVLVSAVKA